MTKQRQNRVNYEDHRTSEVQNYQQSTITNKVDFLEDVNWYHGDITRNVAEALLLSNGKEGTYLLRKSKNYPGYSVSVRCHSAIKHYQIMHDKGKNIFVFGSATFYSVQEVLNHFESIPVINGDTGDMPVILKYPYRNDIIAPVSYADIVAQGEVGKNVMSKGEEPDFEASSKEGFLTKRGAINKNWKERWFVVVKNEIKYFENRKKVKPIKAFDLREAVSISEDSMDGKKNCFNLKFPTRTFYFVAKTPQEVHQWMNFLQWKIDYYKQHKS